MVYINHALLLTLGRELGPDSPNGIPDSMGSYQWGEERSLGISFQSSQFIRRKWRKVRSGIILT